jgi:hypothetical protein
MPTPNRGRGDNEPIYPQDFELNHQDKEIWWPAIDSLIELTLRRTTFNAW